MSGQHNLHDRYYMKYRKSPGDANSCREKVTDCHGFPTRRTSYLDVPVISEVKIGMVVCLLRDFSNPLEELDRRDKVFGYKRARNLVPCAVQLPGGQVLDLLLQHFGCQAWCIPGRQSTSELVVHACGTTLNTDAEEVAALSNRKAEIYLLQCPVPELAIRISPRRE